MREQPEPGARTAQPSTWNYVQAVHARKNETCAVLLNHVRSDRYWLAYDTHLQSIQFKTALCVLSALTSVSDSLLTN